MLADRQYQLLCHKILTTGEPRQDRTGVGTLSIFNHQMIFNMADGFPLLTTKDMSQSFKHIVGEILWMLEGNTNANYLAEKYGFNIWRKWANADGDLGPVYGHQWRNFDGETPRGQQAPVTGVDQISWIMDELRSNPQSRRLLVSAWNPNQLDDMALPPCHWSFELYVDNLDTLHMKLHQRSCDVFLGVPYNIAEYALLLHMISMVADLIPGTLVYDMSNVHIYLNHTNQIIEQIARSPYDSPDLVITRKPESIFEFNRSDFAVVNYEYHPKLTGPVAV